MAECAISDRIAYIDAHQTPVEGGRTEQESEEIKNIISETLLEISDFKKIKKLAQNRMK